MGLRGTIRRTTAILGAIAFAILCALPAAAQMAPPSNVDHPTSDALSKYFHLHKLPMVGAQVSTTADGKRHVMLYGFTATDFGKHDAEQKARDYLKEPSIAIINRIQVNPQLRHLKHGQSPQPPPEQQWDQSAEGEGQPPPPADWEHTVDDMLRRGGASPSNDPSLNMPPPGGPAPAPPGGSW